MAKVLFKYNLLIFIFFLYGCGDASNSLKKTSLSDDILAFYPLDNDANDYSNNNLNGLANSILITKNRFDEPSAFDFHTNESPIRVKSNRSLIFGKSDFSISLWVKLKKIMKNERNYIIGAKSIRRSSNCCETLAGYDLYVNKKGNVIFSMEKGAKPAIHIPGYDFFCPDPDKIPLDYRIDYRYRCAGAKTSLKINNEIWNHIVITVKRNDPSGGHIYINSVLQKRFDPTWISDLSIEFELSDSTDRYILISGAGGNLDEIILYQRVLSEQEILKIYALGNNELLNLIQP